MRKFLFFFAIVTLISCSQNNKEVYIESFEWTLNIPNDWQLSTEIESAIWTEKGKQTIKERVSDNVDTDSFKELIMLNTGFGSLNMFVASYTQFNPAQNYEYNLMMRTKAYERIYKGRKGVSIKTKKSKIKIDGIDFYGHFMEIFKNGKKLAIQFSFERKYANEDILIIQCLATPVHYDNMYKAFLKSKFNRKE